MMNVNVNGWGAGSLELTAAALRVTRRAVGLRLAVLLGDVVDSPEDALALTGHHSNHPSYTHPDTLLLETF